MSDLTERIVTQVCAALVPPEEWGTPADEKPGWIGRGLECDAAAAAAATLRTLALHMPRELREHIQFVAAELVLAGSEEES
jgi:hypothetical protein